MTKLKVVMLADHTDSLADDILEVSKKRRRQLLPWWIKVFMWLFLILGAFLPIVVFLGIMDYAADLTLYGLETNKPFSFVGISIIILFIIKAITSFGFIKEKDWAIKLGIGDSVTGILVCIGLIVYQLLNTEMKFTLRIELFLLIPYLRKLLKIKSEWENTIQVLP